MGLLFAQLARNHGAFVRIFGQNRERTRRVANEFGFMPGSIRNSEDSDWIIVAVPIEATAGVCLRLNKYLGRESILTDVSSVKSGVSDRIAEAPHHGSEYVSLHPLFGPRVSHIFGQDIVMVPYRIGDKWKALADFFEGEGARLHQTNAKTHDKVMAYLQGVHHFGLMCIGLSLKNWDGEYSTGSLRRTFETLQSIVESWGTTVGIQRYNPFCYDARNEFRWFVNRYLKTGTPDYHLIEEPLRLNVQKWSHKQ